MRYEAKLIRRVERYLPAAGIPGTYVHYECNVWGDPASSVDLVVGSNTPEGYVWPPEVRPLRAYGRTPYPSDWKPGDPPPEEATPDDTAQGEAPPAN